MSFFCALPFAATLFSACAAPAPFATGYVEGEYVLVAPVATAQIARLAVARGDRVATGALLVEMERQDAEIALAEAEAALAQAESQLANLREGRRPEEIRVIEATLASAAAQAEEADRAASRVLSLSQRGAATHTQADDAATAATVAHARVAEAEASLAVARLPARPQEIAAAEAAVAGARAASAKAKWNLDERRLTAPAPATVQDVIRTAGELAGPSAPVLSLLPDGAVKLRLYVPEGAVSAIAQGSRLSVRCDGCAEGLSATVTYVADAPEFTPPVIYSLENRQKLVYLIEARPEEPPGQAPGQTPGQTRGQTAGLKPGQIVEVTLPGAGG